MSSISAPRIYQPNPATMQRVDELTQRYRKQVVGTLEPLVRSYCPSLLDNSNNEYRKMVELSTKMTLAGHASTESAGQSFDTRRRMIASLFGGCCFLADSFIDDFGEKAARDYLARFELLLTKGWFEVRTDREKLFYVILARLFTERDALHPTLRQAIWMLYEAQKRDVELRFRNQSLRRLPRRKRLAVLRQCARDRGGHTITTLSAFLVPDFPLAYRSLIFTAGALFMYIDDHGDCYADLLDRRITYMNQVRQPARGLRRIFLAHVGRIARGLSVGAEHDLLIAFLFRYYITRLAKHKEQRKCGGIAWAVYE